MGRENFCIRLTSRDNNEPVYIMVDGMEAFTKGVPEKDDEKQKAFGVVFLRSKETIEVSETPQEIFQITRQTGILHCVPQGG